jgi:hypothetical protein
MRVYEILLPKGVYDKNLQGKQVQDLQMLKKRMDTYVDRIMDPSTSSAAREFLKTKLKDDYHTLKDALRSHGVDTIAENEHVIKYEVYDTKTGEVVGGPYSSRIRARRVADKKDNEYGAYKYGVREIKALNEAVRKLPLIDKDFDLLKELMEKPIPAIIAPIYINEVIDDDMFNGELESLGETDPGRDVRPLIVEWIRRVMPDQMHRFGQEVANMTQRKGVLSPIHGYDMHIYSRGSDSGTGSSGNAYGKF